MGTPPSQAFPFQDTPVAFQQTLDVPALGWELCDERAEGTSNLTPVTQLHLGGLETLSKWSQWRWQ